MKIVIPTMLSVALLSGCISNTEKESVPTKIETAIKTDVNNSMNNIFEITYPNFNTLDEQLKTIRHNKNQNVLENFFYAGIYATYSPRLDDDELNNILLQTKVNLEGSGDKYTKEVREDVSYAYTLKKGLDLFLAETFPITSEELGGYNKSDLGIQFVTYNISEEDFKKNKKDVDFYLDKVKKELKDVKSVKDLTSVPLDYSLLNYTKSNPLLNEEDWNLINDNKDKKIFYVKDSQNIYHFVKIIDDKPLSLSEKSMILSLEKYFAYAENLEPSKIGMDFITTLDSNSEDFNLTPETYEKLTKEVEKLSEEDLLEITRLFSETYTSNFTVIQ